MKKLPKLLSPASGSFPAHQTTTRNRYLTVCTKSPSKEKKRQRQVPFHVRFRKINKNIDPLVLSPWGVADLYHSRGHTPRVARCYKVYPGLGVIDRLSPPGSSVGNTFAFGVDGMGSNLTSNGPFIPTLNHSTEVPHAAWQNTRVSKNISLLKAK